MLKTKGTSLPTPKTRGVSLTRLSDQVGLLGILLYVIFAPHSVAASTIGVVIAVVCWLIRSATTGSLGLRRTKFDLVILLSLFWTFLSAVFSSEPRISIPKLAAAWSVLLFYLARATIERRTAVVLVSVLITSAVAGVGYSMYDLLRGRGVVVQTISSASPFRQVNLQPGDTVWRIDRQRVYSISDIDALLKSASPNTPMSVSVISQGEHVERPGLRTTAELQHLTSPSGLTGTARSHRFRASGWTRHYETFSEVLQIVVQLALGLAFANLSNHGPNKSFKLALAAAATLATGIVLTAMRTVLVAFVIGGCVIAWRALRGIPKVIFTAALFFVIGFGAIIVWQTRGQNAVLLEDPSSSLRSQVARVGLSRIMVHPVLGHGMDAVKLHWTEWGFPGQEMLHLHSTPLQLAFDRGLPMLGLWIWLVVLFWMELSHQSKAASELRDTNYYGLQLGALGALTGLLASSLVNYNFGDSEVVMLFWWLMGVALLDVRQEQKTLYRKAVA